MATTNPITVEDVRAAVAKGDSSARRTCSLLSCARMPMRLGLQSKRSSCFATPAHLEGAADFARRGLADCPTTCDLHEQFAICCPRTTSWLRVNGISGARSTSAAAARTVLAGSALKPHAQGRPGEAEPLFAEADGLAPDNVQLLAYWSKTLEVQHGPRRGPSACSRVPARRRLVRDVDLLRHNTWRGAAVRAKRWQRSMRHRVNGDALLERGRLRDRAGRPRSVERFCRRQAALARRRWS
jgi:hypothetical protein